jgi:ABC-type multidrug transport system fused ATPase/permease subunit
VLPGFSTAGEPSARELAALMDTIRKSGAPAIFVERAARPGIARRLASDAGVRLVELPTCALTAPGGAASTYDRYFPTTRPSRHNGAGALMSVLFSHAPHEPGAPILDVRRVTVRYGERVALDQVSFSLKTGDRVAVVGPNGAGKSTLFKAVAGLLEPNEGEVRVFGHRPLGHICIAYVPQRSQVDWSFPRDGPGTW